MSNGAVTGYSRYHSLNCSLMGEHEDEFVSMFMTRNGDFPGGAHPKIR